jgi:NAD-specific glutamate dehydrogenase
LDDLSQSQRGIVKKLLLNGTTLEEWEQSQNEVMQRTRAFLETLEASGEISVAKLMLASSQIQNLN